MPKFNVILFAGPARHKTKTRNYGVHRLATHIRENGYSCLVVDFCTVLNWETYKEILSLTMDENTYMVGFSTSFMAARFVNSLDPESFDLQHELVDPETSVFVTPEEKKQLAEQGHLMDHLSLGLGGPWLQLIKKFNSKTKIVFGGSYLSYYLDYKEVDNFIYGIAENMTIDYLNSISGRGQRRIFNRILDYDSKSQNSHWDFRSSSTKYTEFDFITSNETLSLETSRGCRFKCSYCSFPLIGQKNINDYLKFKETLRSELLENYERWGITQYYIADDTFNDSTEKIQGIKEVLDTLSFKISFWAYLRIDILAAHPEQILLLKDMGIDSAFFGIETFNDKTGKAIGKGMKSEKIKNTLKKCKEIWEDKVYISSGFIIGLPYESESSIFKTLEYLQDPECPIHSGYLHPLTIMDAKSTDPRLKYHYLSEYDKNYEKYGYYYDRHSKFSDVFFWRKKEDGSDINSYERAIEISNKIQNMYKAKFETGDYWLSSLDHPVLSDREITKKMTQNEYDQLLKSIDMEKLFLETIKNQYFGPLMKKLRAG